MKLGNNDITLKLGSADVDAVYLGMQMVYSGETPTPQTLQWVEYSNGDSIPANLDIYGISGVSQDLANTWGNDSSNPMQFNPVRNKIDILIYCNEQICYNSTDSGSPLATDAVSFIFHDIGCCDYQNQAATVSGTVLLYIYA